MSSLWTPGGEHEVPREQPGPAEAPVGEPDIDPQVQAEMEARMREAQEQLLSVPASQIVTNHVIGLYELGALHLSVDPPNVADARLAIDAMGLLVENLADHLDNADTLGAALHQIRLAYVEVHNAAGEEPAGD